MKILIIVIGIAVSMYASSEPVDKKLMLEEELALDDGQWGQFKGRRILTDEETQNYTYV